MWKPPPVPANEAERLDELHSYGLLDTLPEERFQRITRLATRFYAADVAFLSFIDAKHQWMKAKSSDQLQDTIERDRSICTMIVSSGTPLVIDDMHTAPELEGHPVARDLPWRFYAGVPLRGENGHVIGSLCIMRAEAGPPQGFGIDLLEDLAAISSHELVLAKRNAELHALSNTDALTGLPNRRMFDEEFQRSWRRVRRTGEEVSLLLLDLDHFKEINDSLGHQAGDRALSRFSSFLATFARRPDDLAARIGGEEFALVLSGTDAAGAGVVAARLLDELQQLEIPHPVRGALSASVGVAALQPGEEPDQWLARADRALYAAKAAGRAATRIG